jgi:dsRNA-specific ribonuclease
MQVVIGDAVWGEGRGRSKQKAAQAAAAQALKKAHAADASLAV